MFERARPVATAAALGYVLAGFGGAMTAGLTGWVWTQDPFQQVPNWERVLAQQANRSAGIAVAFLLIFLLAIVTLFFWLSVAARAQRGKHPTSATLGGLFLTVGLLAVAAASIWNGIVGPYAALLHEWTPDAAYKQALFAQLVAATFVFAFGVWCFILFGAVGLYFLGRALREAGGSPRTGWLPDVLRLVAALALLHVPVTIYLARESLLNNHYIRSLAALNELLLWGGLSTATYFAARYLRAEARNLFATAHLSKN